MSFVGEVSQTETKDYDRLLRLADVLDRVPVAKSCLYEMINKNEFPRQIKIGGGRMSFWSEKAVNQWIEDLKAGCQS